VGSRNWKAQFSWAQRQADVQLIFLSSTWLTSTNCCGELVDYIKDVQSGKRVPSLVVAVLQVKFEIISTARTSSLEREEILREFARELSHPPLIHPPDLIMALDTLMHALREAHSGRLLQALSTRLSPLLEARLMRWFQATPINWFERRRRQLPDQREHLKAYLTSLDGFVKGLLNPDGLINLRDVLCSRRSEGQGRDWFEQWYGQGSFTLKDFANKLLLRIRDLVGNEEGWLRPEARALTDVRRQTRLFGQDAVELSAFYVWLQTKSKRHLKSASQQCEKLKLILQERIGDFRDLRAWYEEDLHAGLEACRQVRVCVQLLSY
jgi:hypothetical protein